MLSTGVIRIVGTNDGPTPIAVAEPWRFIQQGQRVRIDDGPLRGVTGIVVRADNGKRLVVSVSMLRRCVAVEVDPRWAVVIQENDSADGQGVQRLSTAPSVTSSVGSGRRVMVRP